MKHRKPRLTQRLYDALVVEWMIGWHQGARRRHTTAEMHWRRKRIQRVGRRPEVVTFSATGYPGFYVGPETYTASTLTVRLQANVEAFSRSMTRANGTVGYLAHRISWQSIKAREQAKARADWDVQRREMWARYGWRPPIVAGGVVVAGAREIQS